MLTLSAPAKLNLFLHVAGKLPSGYHAIESLIAFAQIGDVVHLSPTDTPHITLTVKGPFAAALPKEQNQNIIVKAAMLLRDTIGAWDRGVDIELHKNLPIAAGIGGGSSDAAAVLQGLVSLWHASISQEALLALGAKIGADVPACLLQAPCYAHGFGEKLTPITAFPSMQIVLITPDVPVLAKDVYAAIRPPYGAPPATNAFHTLPTSFANLEALLAVITPAENQMTPAASTLAPVITDILHTLETIPGCVFARLSGSGPTCIGIFTDSTTADAAHFDLKRRFPTAWVCQTTTLQRNTTS